MSAHGTAGNDHRGRCDWSGNSLCVGARRFCRRSDRGSRQPCAWHQLCQRRAVVLSLRVTAGRRWGAAAGAGLVAAPRLAAKTAAAPGPGTMALAGGIHGCLPDLGQSQQYCASVALGAAQPDYPGALAQPGYPERLRLAAQWQAGDVPQPGEFRPCPHASARPARTAGARACRHWGHGTGPGRCSVHRRCVHCQ
ncbi:hypothetical protein D3C78_1325850 [compost metagenome]